ncbi:MAG: His/Gly/Thr/Pro-type tRNA ligase C-terminal domain-containing protein, partial [Oscillospiraceae bacterium]
RSAGIRTQLHCEAKKFKQKISYADKLSIPFVLFLGEDEISAGTVTVKDMTAGTQSALSNEDAISLISAKLVDLNRGTPIRDKN